jgi:hypothetical protein
MRFAQPRHDRQLAAVDCRLKLLWRNGVDVLHVPLNPVVLPIDLDRRGPGVVRVRPILDFERLRLLSAYG